MTTAAGRDPGPDEASDGDVGRGIDGAAELALEADGTARPCLLYDLDWLERTARSTGLPRGAAALDAARRAGDVLVIEDEVHVPVQLLVRRAGADATSDLETMFGRAGGRPRSGVIGRALTGVRLRLPTGRVRFDPLDALPDPVRDGGPPEPHGTLPAGEHLVDVMQVRWTRDPAAETQVRREVLEPGDEVRARRIQATFALLAAATMLLAGGLVAAQVLLPPGRLPVVLWPAAAVASGVAWTWQLRRLHDPAVERVRCAQRRARAAWAPLVVLLAPMSPDLRAAADAAAARGDEPPVPGGRFAVGLRAVASEVAAARAARRRDGA